MRRLESRVRLLQRSHGPLDRWRMLRLAPADRKCCSGSSLGRQLGKVCVGRPAVNHPFRLWVGVWLAQARLIR
jgi:hypothetical protein